MYHCLCLGSFCLFIFLLHIKRFYTLYQILVLYGDIIFPVTVVVLGLFGRNFEGSYSEESCNTELQFDPTWSASKIKFCMVLVIHRSFKYFLCYFFFRHGIFGRYFVHIRVYMMNSLRVQLHAHVLRKDIGKFSFRVGVV